METTFAPATTAEPSSETTGPRYTGVADQRLARTLTAEDQSEEDGLDPLERVTCRTHRRWLHDCVASPLHVVIVTGTRWCRKCECALNVAIDQLAGDVAVRCPSCGEAPATRATRQLVRACRASLATAADR
ncbi:hypothetical protein ACGFMK_24860 [Amycolatopsis sp. NPDC049252]|uniref:hypothetical protein n=1 Tax=Amycolatopsis sp. NPDC049252 TaxID=3363933 RepID=UPI0037167394